MLITVNSMILCSKLPDRMMTNTMMVTFDGNNLLQTMAINDFTKAILCNAILVCNQ